MNFRYIPKSLISGSTGIRIFDCLKVHRVQDTMRKRGQTIHLPGNVNQHKGDDGKTGRAGNGLCRLSTRSELVEKMQCFPKPAMFRAGHD